MNPPIKGLLSSVVLPTGREYIDGDGNVTEIFIGSTGEGPMGKYDVISVRVEWPGQKVQTVYSPAHLCPVWVVVT